MSVEMCSQAGCTGQIEDGYCNVCGSPAGPAQGSGPSAVASHTGITTGTGVSSRLSTSPIGSAHAGSRPTRRLLSTRSAAQHLGAGITTVPAAPVPDPASVVLADPSVAEEKRFCSNCGGPVGRSREGRPGRTEGFCPKCRTAYSFAPKLHPGDLVGGQYEVVGCVAHGGLGWIYLARDKNVSDRYVVLKGLLNAADPDAAAAAVAERQFLAQVQHPLIVGIYNFMLQDGAGYIVMEYVGGQSLKQILKARMAANNGVYDPFPVDQAIAYVVEILPAFSYLHSLGLIYCDFKPDNVIQAGDTLTLLDLGGVRRADDDQSPIYGTTGFQAPEVAELGPSVASDIFTIGRTLAVLAMEFRGYQTSFATTLPDVADTPLFQRYDSLYRLLLRATATDRDDRFQSVDELRDQLLGVLRECVAVDRNSGAAAHSSASALFGPPLATDEMLTWDELPALRVDQSDPAASWLAGQVIADPVLRLTVLKAAPDRTVEVRLAEVRAGIESAQYNEADATIEALLADNPWEWRAVWMSGLAALTRGRLDVAVTAFNTVLGQVPGELAPKLALALACELSGESDVAKQLYQVCAVVDANYTASAAFGLARRDAFRGDIDGALAALDLITPVSGSYVASRQARAGLLANSGKGLEALAAAVDSVADLPIDPRDRQEVVVEVLKTALEEVQANGPEPGVTIAGIPATERTLRAGAEQAYRDLAMLTTTRADRIRLVDQANAIRPRTWV